MSIKVYEVITDTILEKLEQGVVPWRQTWSGSAPKSLITKKEYRGINVFLLSACRYASSYWLTAKQAKEKGGHVRKGEKGTPVIFWKMFDKDDGTKGKAFILRYYTVFNVLQCEDIEAPLEETNVVEPITECESLVKLYSDIPAIDRGGDRACYNPSFDRISMPHMNAFTGAEEYYSTLFHELIHSTGHSSRLDRDGVMNPIRFGSHDYSFEELVAECGAAFLCGKAGILNNTIDNSASYIASWAKVLKSEPKWIVEAASKAMKAAEYIQGVKWADKRKSQEESEAA